MKLSEYNDWVAVAMSVQQPQYSSQLINVAVLLIAIIH